MKVQLVPISYSELKGFISLAFADDIELQESLHISPGTHEEITDHTYNMIMAWGGEYNFEYYKVVIGSGVATEAVGFTVLLNDGGRVLYSFGINILKRCREVLVNWLVAVRETFGAEFGVSLWEKNERAINFFRKNGFVNSTEMISGSSDKMILLWP